MTIGSELRDTHFEMIYQETKDFGRVQFVEKIQQLEDIIDSLEEEIQDLYIERSDYRDLEETIDELEMDKESLEDDYNNLYDELEEYKGYEEEVENIHKDIEWFMFKLRMDKCYTKELEEFIKNYGGELFN